jgi:predicted metal-dependent phosphoesterase TrpH
MTPIGELMGLFLTQEIPRGLSAQETITRIKSQGGLVNIPHPFGHSFRENKKLLSQEILSQVDLIEVFNSRIPFPSSFPKASKLASEYGLPASAGSDAHTIREIGRAHVEMPEFNGPEDFLDCLTRGKIFGQRSSSLLHFVSLWWKTRKRLLSC